MNRYIDIFNLFKRVFTFSYDFNFNYLKNIVHFIVASYHITKKLVYYTFIVFKIIIIKSVQWSEKINILKNFFGQVLSKAIYYYLKTILKKKKPKGIL